MAKKTHILTHHFGGTELNKFASTKHHDEKIVDGWHRQRFGAEAKSSLGWHIGYYKLFLYDGRVIKCREAWEEQFHAIGMNSSALGYAFAGNYTTGSQDRISEAQKEAFVREAKIDMQEFGIGIENIEPHRKYASYKDCHGDQLPDDFFRSLLKESPEVAPVIKKDAEEIQKQINSLSAILALLTQQIMVLLRKNQAKLLSAIFKRSAWREIGKKTYKIA